MTALIPKKSANLFTTKVMLNDPSVFEQYVVNLRDGSTVGADNRDDFLAYAAARRGKNEQLQPSYMRIDPAADTTYVEFSPNRRAADNPAARHIGEASINQLRWPVEPLLGDDKPGSRPGGRTIDGPPLTMQR